MDESQRRVAKTVNFGVIYGLSPFGLAARLGITQAEAARVHRRLFPGIRRGRPVHHPGARGGAWRKGRVETILGRRRPISRDQDRRPDACATWPSARPSTPIIQGSAADLIKRAMIRIDQELRDRGLAGPDAAPDPRRAGLRGPRRGDRRASPRWSAAR